MGTTSGSNSSTFRAKSHMDWCALRHAAALSVVLVRGRRRPAFKSTTRLAPLAALALSRGLSPRRFGVAFASKRKYATIYFSVRKRTSKYCCALASSSHCSSIQERLVTSAFTCHSLIGDKSNQIFRTSPNRKKSPISGQKFSLADSVHPST